MTNDEFEALAAAFYAATDIMAPGKDAGPVPPTHSHDERREAWLAWLNEGPQR